MSTASNLQYVTQAVMTTQLNCTVTSTQLKWYNLYPTSPRCPFRALSLSTRIHEVDFPTILLSKRSKLSTKPQNETQTSQKECYRPRVYQTPTRSPPPKRANALTMMSCLLPVPAPSSGEVIRWFGRLTNFCFLCQ